MTPDERIVLELYEAWVDFRKTHDLKDAKIACCERTQRLFSALAGFELLVQADLQ